jgi:hypothetical protein
MGGMFRWIKDRIPYSMSESSLPGRSMFDVSMFVSLFLAPFKGHPDTTCYAGKACHIVLFVDFINKYFYAVDVAIDINQHESGKGV